MAADGSLKEVLRGLVSPDNATRNAAERHYQDALQRQPGAVAAELMQFLRSGDDSAEGAMLRAFSAVLLRRVVDPQGANWNKMSQRERKLVRVGLLVAFATEASPSVARKVCHAVAMAARSEVAWPELVPAVAARATDASAARRELAFFLAEKIADDADDDAFAEATATALLPPCAAGLADATVAVAAAAATATMALLAATRQERLGQRHAELCGPILEVLRRALQDGDEMAAVALMEAMSRLANAAPMLFRPALADTAASLLAVAGAGAATLEFRTRSAAAEVLLTLCERVPAVARKCTPLACDLLPVLMEMACEVDEDQSGWAAAALGPSAAGGSSGGSGGSSSHGNNSGGNGPLDAEDEDEDGHYGVEAMYRCVQALQGKATLAAGMRTAPPALQSPDWRRRRAGLCLMAALADGAGSSFRPLAVPAAVAAASAAQDTAGGPRVVYQALTLLGRLIDEYPSEIFGSADASAGTVAAIATQVADEAACARVRARAASAAINYAQAAERLADDAGANAGAAPQVPHADAMLAALCACLRGAAPPVVAGCALEAVAALAAAGPPGGFDGYYDAFAPGLKAVVAGSAAAAARGKDSAATGLLGSALKAVAAVGKAVGPARAAADASVVMNVLGTALRHVASGGGAGGEAAAEFIGEQVAPALAALAPLLGEEAFRGWLPTVLPPLYAALDAPPDFKIEEVGAAEAEAEADMAGGGSNLREDEDGTKSMLMNVPGVGPRRMTLNTTAVEQKINAASCLQDLAIAAGAGFAPHASDAAPRLLAALEFQLSEEVRAQAALALGEVFCSVLAAFKSGGGGNGGEAVSALLCTCVERLLVALNSNFDTQPESRTCVSSALKDILCACQESGGEDPASSGMPLAPLLQLPLSAAATATHELCKVARESMERRQQFEAAIATSSGAFDDDDAEGLAEELAPEEELCEHVVDCIGYLIKGNGPAFLPVFDAEVAPLYAPLLGTAPPGSGAPLSSKNGKGRKGTAPQQVLLQGPTPAALRLNAICTFVDVIEHCGDAAQKHLSACLPAFFAALGAGGMLPMAAAYGVQQVARRAPAALLPLLPTVLPQLGALAAAEAGGDDARYARENAAAALARICCEPAFAEAVAPHRAQLLALWAATLPFTADESEARAAHSLLCDLVEGGDAALLGPDLACTPKLIEIMAKVLEEASSSSSDSNNSSSSSSSSDATAPCGKISSDLVDAATAERMGRLLARMRDGGLPSPLLQAAWKGLTDGQQRAVQRAMMC